MLNKEGGVLIRAGGVLWLKMMRIRLRWRKEEEVNDVKKYLSFSNFSQIYLCRKGHSVADSTLYNITKDIQQTVYFPSAQLYGSTNGIAVRASEM